MYGIAVDFWRDQNEFSKALFSSVQIKIYAKKCCYPETATLFFEFVRYNAESKDEEEKYSFVVSVFAKSLVLVKISFIFIFSIM